MLIRILFLIWIVSLSACTSHVRGPATKAGAKNVILVIGDGMGPQQVGLLMSYARQAPQSIISNRQTAFDRIVQTGQMTFSLTHAHDTLVVDSAASATQLATGHSAGPEMIGLDETGKRQDNIVTLAKRAGKATGLVSDTRITHATPAAFAAHQVHRSMETAIAEDLLKAEPDVMLSAGLSYWLPNNFNAQTDFAKSYYANLTAAKLQARSKRADGRDLLAEAAAKGYRLVFDKNQLGQANGKTLGLFAPEAMMNGIVENKSRLDPLRTEPTLQEMTAKALAVLSENPNGFFLMVEAGQIDWAGHRNDTGWMLHEMLRLNTALNYILDWAQGRDDTLVIVTADHETGGFGFSYSATGAAISNTSVFERYKVKKEPVFRPSFNYGNPEILDRLYRQKKTYDDLFAEYDALPSNQQTPENLVQVVNSNTEFHISPLHAKTILATEPNPIFDPEHKELSQRIVPKMNVNGEFFPYQIENRSNLLAQAVSRYQQATWSTGTHTSTPVYVFVKGPQALLSPFKKILHHTEIGRLAISAMN